MVDSNMFVAAAFRQTERVILMLQTVYCSIPIAGIKTDTASKDPLRV